LNPRVFNVLVNYWCTTSRRGPVRIPAFDALLQDIEHPQAALPPARLGGVFEHYVSPAANAVRHIPLLGMAYLATSPRINRPLAGASSERFKIRRAGAEFGTFSAQYRCILRPIEASSPCAHDSRDNMPPPTRLSVRDDRDSSRPPIAGAYCVVWPANLRVEANNGRTS